jgi:hypothetical protein
MEKVSYVIDSLGTEHALIDHGDNTFTSMTKAHYDELKANEAETV